MDCILSKWTPAGTENTLVEGAVRPTTLLPVMSDSQGRIICFCFLLKERGHRKINKLENVPNVYRQGHSNVVYEATKSCVS